MKAKDGVGRYGERVAAAHLVDAGMQIVELNWRCRDGEIDIVARDGDTVVFCEVNLELDAYLWSGSPLARERASRACYARTCARRAFARE